MLLFPASVPIVRAALIAVGFLCNIFAVVAGFFGHWSPSAHPLAREPGLYDVRGD